MFKDRNIWITVAIFSILNTLLYYLQGTFKQPEIVDLGISYLINGLFSLFWFIALPFLITYFPRKMGLVYLCVSFVKIGILLVVFSKAFNPSTPLTMTDKMALFIPYFSSLFAELGFLTWKMDKIP